MDDIKTRVRAYITDNFLFGQDDDLKDEASLLSRGVLDSTGVLELVMFLEQTFGIGVEDDELVPENLDSLNAIAAYVNRKRTS
jgi:acyl carrier protein